MLELKLIHVSKRGQSTGHLCGLSHKGPLIRSVGLLKLPVLWGTVTLKWRQCNEFQTMMLYEVLKYMYDKWFDSYVYGSQLVLSHLVQIIATRSWILITSVLQWLHISFMVVQINGKSAICSIACYCRKGFHVVSHSNTMGSREADTPCFRVSRYVADLPPSVSI